MITVTDTLSASLILQKPVVDYDPLVNQTAYQFSGEVGVNATYIKVNNSTEGIIKSGTYFIWQGIIVEGENQFSVFCGNEAGKSPEVSFSVICDLTPPDAPSNFRITTKTQFGEEVTVYAPYPETYTVTKPGVLLEWDAPEENCIYEVWISKDGVTWEFKASTSFLYYFCSDLYSGLDYYFKVRARDLAGNFGEFSEIIKITYIDIIAPAPPTGLRGSVGSEWCWLVWNKSPEFDTAGYHLYRLAEGTPKYYPYSAEFPLAPTYYPARFKKGIYYPAGYYPHIAYGYGYYPYAEKDRWVRINDELITKTEFIDYSVYNEVNYWYVVTAVDTSENESEFSVPIRLVPHEEKITEMPPARGRGLYRFKVKTRNKEGEIIDTSIGVII